MMTLTEKWKMEGLQRGIIEGLRESILYTVELKFGSVPNDFKDKLNTISDVNRLKEIQKKVIFANTLNDIVVE
ncbi:hypothetical protein [Sulfurihydrogenibium subterraneum]|uniref:hypothetical protein n=1 Tax=Sulfurihydrogenibium subterraneum TaxID=171121 RepID=UPI00048A9A00|nr:hypothetical protein [Sulfurihydrogenibium subterraneum]